MKFKTKSINSEKGSMTVEYRCARSLKALEGFSEPNNRFEIISTILQGVKFFADVDFFVPTEKSESNR